MLPAVNQSMIKFITYYSPLIADDGILIIEDVQNFDWLETLRKVVLPSLKQYIKIYRQY